MPQAPGIGASKGDRAFGAGDEQGAEAASGPAARRAAVAVRAGLAASALAAAGMLVQFFGLDADDAYIVLRYAYNWVHNGAFVYNLGEPITALTSPLHALLIAVLHGVVEHVQLANKLVGLACQVAAVLLVVRPFRRQPLAAFSALALAALSPYLLLWSVAGLETPILSLLVTAIAVLVYRHRGEAQLSAGVGLALSALCGLAFLTRFDSILFLFPILLVCARRLPLPRAVVCALPGLVISLSWLAFSQSNFGAILPTSFYVKTGGIGLRWIIGNAVYMADFYLFSGILVLQLALFALVVLHSDGWSRLGRPHMRALWWAYASWGLLAGYGLLTARVHMMFSFRMVVPYLPVAALLIADLAARAVDGEAAARSGAVRVLRAAVAAVVVLQGIGFLVVRLENIGGGRTGEFHATSSVQMERTLEIFRQEADAIRSHWQHLPASRERGPRIHTHAAGILPYHLPEATAYDPLITYRHRCRLSDEELRRQSDYFLIFYPRTLPEDVFRGYLQRYEVVFEKEWPLDGVPRRWFVFHNADPEPFTLPPGIDEPCLQGRS